MTADDLADRLDEIADPNFPGVIGYSAARDLRAAAAELRRLRHRDATLTTLLDAVGDAEGLRDMAKASHRVFPVIAGWLRRVAAAVEVIDREHER